MSEQALLLRKICRIFMHTHDIAFRQSCFVRYGDKPSIALQCPWQRVARAPLSTVPKDRHHRHWRAIDGSFILYKHLRHWWALDVPPMKPSGILQIFSGSGDVS